MHLPCVHCRKPVRDKEGRLFAEVFVCPTCYTLAERCFKRSENELKRLLLVLKDSIRVALIEGRLQSSPGLSEELPKEAVLRAITSILEEKDG